MRGIGGAAETAFGGVDADIGSNRRGLSAFAGETGRCRCRDGAGAACCSAGRGHGGADGGAVSDSGVAESGINLAITQRLAEIFSFFGQPVMLTRTGEASLCGPEDETLRQQKVSDTRNRVALVNGCAGARLISIHQNCLPGYPLVRGAQSFYNGAAGGQEMADLIQQALNDAVNVSAKESKRISDSIYLMKHAECPAVLVECGFLSNREETTLLQQPEYQVQLAAAIAAGYLQYCTSEGEL